MRINEVIQSLDLHSWTIVVDIVWLHCDSAPEFSCCCAPSAAEFTAVVRELKILVVV